MKDSIIGVDKRNDHIWIATPLTDQTGTMRWWGTGRDMLFVTHPTMRDALAFFIDHYPDADSIQFNLAGKYAQFSVGGVRLNLILDAIEAALSEAMR